MVPPIPFEQRRGNRVAIYISSPHPGKVRDARQILTMLLGRSEIPDDIKLKIRQRLATDPNLRLR